MKVYSRFVRGNSGKFEHPQLFPRITPDKEYARMLMYLAEHPDSSEKKVLMSLYGKIKNFTEFRNLHFEGLIAVSSYGYKKCKKCRQYSLDLRGYEILAEVFDIPDEVFFKIEKLRLYAKNAESLEELKIAVSIAGEYEEFFSEKAMLKLMAYTSSYNEYGKFMSSCFKRCIPFFDNMQVEYPCLRNIA